MQFYWPVGISVWFPSFSDWSDFQLLGLTDSPFVQAKVESTFPNFCLSQTNFWDLTLNPGASACNNGSSSLMSWPQLPQMQWQLSNVSLYVMTLRKSSIKFVKLKDSSENYFFSPICSECITCAYLNNIFGYTLTSYGQYTLSEISL